jgi:hypothetical protein
LEICDNLCAIPGTLAVFERHFLALCPFFRTVSKAMLIFRCDFRRNGLFSLLYLAECSGENQFFNRFGAELK